MMKKTLILSISVFLAAACVSAAKDGGAGKLNKSSRTPDWVEGSSSSYPSAAYIIGTGSADDMDTAKDRARGEISKVFSADILKRLLNIMNQTLECFLAFRDGVKCVKAAVCHSAFLWL